MKKSKKPSENTLKSSPDLLSVLTSNMPASSKEKGDVIILKSLLATNAQRKWLNVWKHYWSKFIPKKKRLTNKNTMCLCLDTKIELKFI